MNFNLRLQLSQQTSKQVLPQASLLEILSLMQARKFDAVWKDLPALRNSLPFSEDFSKKVEEKMELNMNTECILQLQAALKSDDQERIRSCCAFFLEEAERGVGLDDRWIWKIIRQSLRLFHGFSKQELQEIKGFAKKLKKEGTEAASWTRFSRLLLLRINNEAQQFSQNLKLLEQVTADDIEQYCQSQAIYYFVWQACQSLLNCCQFSLILGLAEPLLVSWPVLATQLQSHGREEQKQQIWYFVRKMFIAYWLSEGLSPLHSNKDADLSELNSAEIDSEFKDIFNDRIGAAPRLLRKIGLQPNEKLEKVMVQEFTIEMLPKYYKKVELKEAAKLLGVGPDSLRGGSARAAREGFLWGWLSREPRLVVEGDWLVKVA